MILLLAFSAAFAQETDTLTDTAAPRVIYQTVSVVDFEERHVEASADGPSMKFVAEFDHGPHAPLMRIRVSWDDELGRSVDEVK
jgi:hypothetical protein